MRTADFWHNRPVFVTGATGMIGSWLVKKLLANNARVIALVLDADPQSELIRSGDISRCTVVNGSLQHFDTLERAVNVYEAKTVIHLGAQTIVGAAHRFPLPTFEANIRGTYNLLEVCRVHQGLVEQIVVASSDKAYGESDRPYTEDMPLKGSHPYEVSKTCTDLLAQSYATTYRLPVTIARCGNVFGGGDLNWSRIVPGTIKSLLAEQAPEIRSDGKYVRDYIYVKDIADAYMTLATRTDEPTMRGESFNFSAAKPLTVMEIVGKLQSLMGKQNIKPKILNCCEGEIRSQILDTTKAAKVLHWQPEFDVDKGLSETITWYQSFLRVGS